MSLLRIGAPGVLLLAALLVARSSPITAGVASPTASKTPVAQRREVKIPIRDFSLTDQNGRRFQLQSVKGKVIVVAFAYTTCPDVCPLITAAMRKVQEDLNASERSAVYLITVTADPEVDEPRVLASYAKRYAADLSNWAFVTGDEQSLAEVWKNFGVRVRRKARGLIDHTPLIALVDRSATMRLGYFGTAPNPQIMLEDIRFILGRAKRSDS